MSVPNKKLWIDWCSYDAAKFAVMHWHYSKKMPGGKLVKFGVWEQGDFIGAVIFGDGICRYIGKPFGLGVETTQACELVRVALNDHKSAVTKVLSVCIRKLKEAFMDMRVVVSFADSGQDHLGVIYQAGNWYYLGHTRQVHYTDNYGKIYHSRTLHDSRTVSSVKRTQIAKKLKNEGKLFPIEQMKHKYAYPLDPDMRRLVSSMQQPYPRRRKHSGDVPADQAGEGSSILTSAPHEKRGKDGGA